jgi:hypothetical protein
VLALALIRQTVVRWQEKAVRYHPARYSVNLQFQAFIV